MSGKNDLANYRKMSEPFANIEEANEALKSFYQAVEEARKEFHIMDVHVIVKMNVLRGETEGMAMTSAHYGNTLEGAPMCAWGLGQEQATFEANLQRSKMDLEKLFKDLEKVQDALYAGDFSGAKTILYAVTVDVKAAEQSVERMGESLA